MGFDDVVEHITEVAQVLRARKVGGQRGVWLPGQTEARCSCGWVGKTRRTIEQAYDDGRDHEARSYINSFGGR